MLRQPGLGSCTHRGGRWRVHPAAGRTVPDTDIHTDADSFRTIDPNTTPPYGAAGRTVPDTNFNTHTDAYTHTHTDATADTDANPNACAADRKDLRREPRKQHRHDL